MNTSFSRFFVFKSAVLPSLHKCIVTCIHPHTYVLNTYSARGVKSLEFETLNVSVEGLLILLLSNCTVPTENLDLHVVVIPVWKRYVKRKFLTIFEIL